jgi:hypothetical protein
MSEICDELGMVMSGKPGSFVKITGDGGSCTFLFSNDVSIFLGKTKRNLGGYWIIKIDSLGPVKAFRLNFSIKDHPLNKNSFNNFEKTGDFRILGPRLWISWSMGKDLYTASYYISEAFNDVPLGLLVNYWKTTIPAPGPSKLTIFAICVAALLVATISVFIQDVQIQKDRDRRS